VEAGICNSSRPRSYKCCRTLPSFTLREGRAATRKAMPLFSFSFLLYPGITRLVGLLALTAHVFGMLRNATIDDQYGGLRTGEMAVAYYPPGVWQYGPTCAGCKAKLDTQRTLQGTWHDSTSLTPEDNRNVTISFIGKNTLQYIISFANRITRLCHISLLHYSKLHPRHLDNGESYIHSRRTTGRVIFPSP
jgi:hypothetical protein